jgi:hypothetical protein
MTNDSCVTVAERSRHEQLTICPCCGVSFEGTLNEGCKGCGAQSVGEALPRPEHELPFYGRSLLLAVTGTLMVLVFLVQTIIAFAQSAPQGLTPQLVLSSIVSFDFWAWVAAAETAAWRLKWIAIPFTIVILWAGRKLYYSMLKTPSRFCGLGYARGGMIASALIPLLIVVLIGVTVPERLRQRESSSEAASWAGGHTIARAQLQYQAKFGTFAADLNDLRQLPDHDGSIAAALKNIDVASYKPNAEVAALPKQKPQRLRGAVILNASLSTATDDSLGEGLSFTNYELRLPGPDKLSGTDDDLIVRDGLVKKASDDLKKQVAPNPSTAVLKP